MTKNTQIQKLIHYFGNQTKTAEALKVSQPTVSGWLRGQYNVSPIIAIRAEKKTNGKFKAKKLCPALAAA